MELKKHLKINNKEVKELVFDKSKLTTKVIRDATTRMLFAEERRDYSGSSSISLAEYILSSVVNIAVEELNSLHRHDYNALMEEVSDAYCDLNDEASDMIKSNHEDISFISLQLKEPLPSGLPVIEFDDEKISTVDYRSAYASFAKDRARKKRQPAGRENIYVTENLIMKQNSMEEEDFNSLSPVEYLYLLDVSRVICGKK